MIDSGFIAIYSRITLLIFAALLVLAVARVITRLRLFLKAHLAVPVLIRRNIVLFGTSGIYVFINLIFRAEGINPPEQPWYSVWVIISGAALDLALGYWVYVEYFLLDNPNID